MISIPSFRGFNGYHVADDHGRSGSLKTYSLSSKKWSVNSNDIQGINRYQTLFGDHIKT